MLLSSLLICCIYVCALMRSTDLHFVINIWLVFLHCTCSSMVNFQWTMSVVVLMFIWHDPIHSIILHVQSKLLLIWWSYYLYWWRWRVDKCMCTMGVCGLNDSLSNRASQYMDVQYPSPITMVLTCTVNCIIIATFIMCL